MDEDMIADRNCLVAEQGQADIGAGRPGLHSRLCDPVGPIETIAPEDALITRLTRRLPSGAFRPVAPIF
ncbi:MAG: hypothetical protein WDN49_04860 [Acetobacteraceae bacterium]